MMRLPLSFIVCATVLLTMVRPATAQTPRPERPYRGLFGGNVGATEDLLTLSFSLLGGYDTNVLLDPFAGGGSGVVDPLLTESSGYGGFAAGLHFSLNRSRVTLDASANSAGHYYSGQSEFVGTHSGFVGVAWQSAKNTRVIASQGISYQPFLLIDIFPQLIAGELGQQPSPSRDRGTLRGDYLTHQTTVGLDQRVSRRSSFNLRYGYHSSDFGDGDRDFTTQTARGGFSFDVAKGLGARLGYGYTVGDYLLVDQTRRVGSHNIDAGIDMSRSLSFSRRTTFSFGTGLGAVADTNQTYYNVIGNARLNHEIGRSWTASAAYTRNIGFLERFAEPFFSDSISVGLAGLMHRRLQFRSSLHGSLGDVGLSASANGFATYVAASGITFGLSRYVGLGVDYSYYRYAFDGGALLPAGLPSELGRHSVQSSLNLWAPLVSRARRADASR